ncbi:MAG: CapA family protein [Longicatena sp.]
MMKKLIGIFIGLVLLSGCSLIKEEMQAPVTKEAVAQEKDDIEEISFSAVGDNLIHGAIYYYNDKGNGHYDFKDIYEHTNYLTQASDIAYINQETICGGTQLGLSTYPSFNGPYEVLDAISSAGFDWMAASSNHTMDAGTQGIINQLTYMKQHYPDIKITGSHANQEDASTLQYIERKGVKFGILGYTYGLNGYTLPQDKAFMIDVIDKEKIKKDMEALNKGSDVQLVSMHWGDEYSHIPSKEQKELAQYLSDLGADVIIGEHPHVIQPMDHITGEKGNHTLVIYSLGNFLSAQDEPDRMLGGMAKWKIAYNKTTKDVELKDVEFWPTITHIEKDFSFYRTYVLKDYNNDLATKHVLSSKNMTKEYFITKVQEVMNDKVKIVY